MPEPAKDTSSGTQTPPAGATTSTGGVEVADPRVAALEAENARLREQLAAAGKPATPAKPTEPSFGLSEGQRDELERTGRTVSPFTGARQVGTGKPGAKPRTATADEFAKATPAGQKS